MPGMMNMAPEQAPQGAPAPQQPQAVQQPKGEKPPAYETARALVAKALYKAGAAEGVAKAIRESQDPVEALANTAYEMVSVADERTNGEVPDELLISLASSVMGEVAEIANAAGVKVGGAQIAGAMQKWLLRFVQEQGIDPAQLQQAMGQIDPERLGAALDQAGGAK